MAVAPIFISYASADKAVAEAVCEGLEAAGLRCWMAPRDIRAGEEYPAAIATAVTQGAAFVLIFSVAANESRHVQNEVDLAFNSDQPIIPFRIAKVEPSLGMAYYLNRRQWFDAVAPPLAARITELVTVLRALPGLAASGKRAPTAKTPARAKAATTKTTKAATAKTQPAKTKTTKVAPAATPTPQPKGRRAGRATAPDPFEQLARQTAESTFRTAVQEALRDGVITDGEKHSLRELQQRLALTDADVRRLIAEAQAAASVGADRRAATPAAEGGSRPLDGDAGRGPADRRPEVGQRPTLPASASPAPSVGADRRAATPAAPSVGADRRGATPAAPSVGADRRAATPAPSRLPPWLLPVPGADYAPLVGLAVGSREAQQVQRQIVSQLGLPLEVKTARTGIRFRLIPAGTFLMGSPADEAGRDPDELQHRVTLTRPYYCGRFAITQAEWLAAMPQNPAYYQAGGPAGPVDSVSYEDCLRFLAGLAAREGAPVGVFRLPTEAEWEYACRAGTQTPFCYGTKLDAALANFDGRLPYGGPVGVCRDTPSDSGSFPPNAWGLYDCHGNVWEWCADWYGPYPTSPVTDPVGPASGERRLSRGGGVGSNGVHCRSAARNWPLPTDRFRDLGLRLVVTVGPLFGGH